jgi:hypothetical protein
MTSQNDSVQCARGDPNRIIWYSVRHRVTAVKAALNQSVRPVDCGPETIGSGQRRSSRFQHARQPSEGQSRPATPAELRDGGRTLEISTDHPGAFALTGASSQRNDTQVASSTDRAASSVPSSSATSRFLPSAPSRVAWRSCRAVASPVEPSQQPDFRSVWPDTLGQATSPKFINVMALRPGNRANPLRSAVCFRG